MKYLVTGAAGFIGSNLVDSLLEDGHEVVGYDNFSTGQEPFLEAALQHANFRLVRGDILDLPVLTVAMRGCEAVYHLAANADVRFGLDHPERDVQQNTLGTFNVLEAMRANRARIIGFSSTGSVYGEAPIIPTPEQCAFPIQTSLYAASKVAGECLIQAYCEGYGFEGYIFRFVSILGERYTHGHIFDFVKQLRADPAALRILGDGHQRKSYLYVGDCIAAIRYLVELETAKAARHHVEIYNLGTQECCEVRDSVGWITGRMGLQPQLEFTGGERGWVGDNPYIYLDTAKVRKTGWAPNLTIEQGVVRTVEWLEQNPWVFEKR